MFLNVVKGNSLYVLILIPLLGILLWLKTFLSLPLEALPNESFQMPLYEYLQLIMKRGNTTYLPSILGLGLLVAQTYLLIQHNIKYGIVENKTYLPAIIFLLLSSSFIQLQRFHPIFIANIFLLGAMNLIFDSFKKEKCFGNFFNSALLLSMGSLFYVNMIFYVVFVYIGLVILRPFNWREWVFALLGFLLPYVMVMAYNYYTDVPFLDFWITVWLNLMFDNFRHCYNISYYIFYGFIFGLLVLSSYYMLMIYRYKNISARNYLLVYVWLFLLTAVIFMLVRSASAELLVIGAVPISYILSNYLLCIKSRWWGEIIWTVLIVLVVFLEVVNGKNGLF